MKKLAGTLLFILLTASIYAQRNCRTFEYGRQLLAEHPELSEKILAIESFSNKDTQRDMINRVGGDMVDDSVIRIPVVFHIVYHYNDENISEERIRKQIEVLNRDFGKMNADTTNIPVYFQSLAADTKIEFVLATSDPAGRATNGIVRHYSPVTRWEMDDKVKFSAETGADAWDAGSYLNIWTCNLQDLLGYSSFPGTPAEQDGVVLNYRIVGEAGLSQYNKGRTAVHEVGHWLNLHHIWGDADCGDDGVSDTPTQRSYTAGCPSGKRITCGNDPNGDMYMNYMDFTNDACVYMFTLGQKKRMRSLFEPGGARYSIVHSRGLDTPVSQEIPLPESGPQWLHVNVYPNPAHNSVRVNFEYDIRWLGQELTVLDVAGKVMIRHKVTAAVDEIQLDALKPGIYFIRGQKGNEKILQKIIKL